MLLRSLSKGSGRGGRVALLALTPLLLAAAVVVPDMLEPRVLAKKSFSETYTLIADLEGEIYLQLQVGVSNLGLSSRRGACRALLVEPGAPTWTEAVEVPNSEWSFVPGGRPSLQVGRCSLSGGEQTDFHAEFAAGSIDLHLSAPISPVRPLDRRMTVGEDFYESDVMIPWAAASASIRVGGGEARVLRGRGYGDHSRSTTLPASLARRWVRFRGLAEADSVLILARFPRDTEQIDGWIWRQADTAPVELASLALEPVGAAAAEPPQWQISLASRAGAAYRLTTERAIHRDAPLEGHGLAGRMLRSLVGSPVTHTYRAMLESADASGAPVRLPGIAEVTLVGE